MQNFDQVKWGINFFRSSETVSNLEFDQVKSLTKVVDQVKISKFVQVKTSKFDQVKIPRCHHG